MPITIWSSNNTSQVLTEIVRDYNNNQRDEDARAELILKTPQDYASSAKEALNILKDPGANQNDVPNMVLAPEFMTGDMLKAVQENHVISASILLDEERRADIPEIVSRTFGPHCLPFNPACGVLYINSSLLEQAGEDPEWKPNSLEDLVAMSQKLRKAGVVENGYTCAWPEAYLAEAVLAQTNKSLLTDQGEYNFSQLSSHIFDIWKLVREGVFLPPAAGNYNPTLDLFINRKVVFYMQGSGHYYSLIAAKAADAKFTVKCSPLPTLSMGQKEKYAFPLGGSAIWVLNKNVTQKMVEGVRNFLNYFSSAAVQEKCHREMACVPVSRSVTDQLKEFYASNPLHKAVVDQTINAKLGENSFGIKKEGYKDVRGKFYPMIRELITLQGSEEEVRQIINERLKAFDSECNKAQAASQSPLSASTYVINALVNVYQHVVRIICCDC